MRCIYRSFHIEGAARRRGRAGWRRTNADSTLAAVKDSPADVVVCDIRMPGHDGVWLIDQLQQRYPATAIVIVTGIQDLDPRLTTR
jgi:DNA-binding NarL/FixJ family response regulator